MLQRETRTLYENSENYGAIPCFRDSLIYGMVRYFSKSSIIFLQNPPRCMQGMVSHMLQQETRTLYENSENYGAIPCFKDSLKYGMVKHFQNLPSFSCKTFLNVCKAWFHICSNKKQELCMKIQRIMGPFHVLEIL